MTECLRQQRKTKLLSSEGLNIHSISFFIKLLLYPGSEEVPWVLDTTNELI